MTAAEWFQTRFGKLFRLKADGRGQVYMPLLSSGGSGEAHPAAVGTIKIVMPADRAEYVQRYWPSLRVASNGRADVAFIAKDGARMDSMLASLGAVPRPGVKISGPVRSWHPPRHP